MTTLDNQTGHSVTLTYSKTVGTAFSREHSNSFHVSETVENELKFAFFDIMGYGIGLSETTGKDWSSLSASEKADSITITVDCHATSDSVSF